MGNGKKKTVIKLWKNNMIRSKNFGKSFIGISFREMDFNPDMLHQAEVLTDIPKLSYEKCPLASTWVDLNPNGVF